MPPRTAKPVLRLSVLYVITVLAAALILLIIRGNSPRFGKHLRAYGTAYGDYKWTRSDINKDEPREHDAVNLIDDYYTAGDESLKISYYEGDSRAVFFFGDDTVTVDGILYSVNGGPLIYEDKLMGYEFSDAAPFIYAVIKNAKDKDIYNNSYWFHVSVLAFTAAVIVLTAIYLYSRKQNQRS
jgi:hypothetical protein